MVPKVIRCRVWKGPRNKVKVGVPITRGLAHSAQELELDPKEHGGPLRGFRKLTQQNERLTFAILKAR